MAGIRNSLDRAGYERLSGTLSDIAAEAGTGELRVSGSPGGAFHFRDGLVIAVESPGAPDAEALLLRSGRVTGEQWAELMREPGAERWPEAGLIAHGYAGAVQLRVVAMMAMQDAVFAILAGRMDTCEPLHEGRPLAPVPQGETPARLLREATRKLAALAALPLSIRPDSERPVRAPSLDHDVISRLPPSQQELLAHADGRRTARDIAFRTGRGVYTVTIEMSRMLQEGHLTCPDRSDELLMGVPVEGLARRIADPEPAEETESRPPREISPAVLSALASAVTPPPAEPPPAPDTPTPEVPRSLPQRRPGASGITETLGPNRSGTSWKGFFRLRSRIRPSGSGI